MRWRVREIARGSYVVERKGGLWWAPAAWNYAWFDALPRRFDSAGDAHRAMCEAIADWQFRPRVIAAFPPPPGGVSR